MLPRLGQASHSYKSTHILEVNHIVVCNIPIPKPRMVDESFSARVVLTYVARGLGQECGGILKIDGLL